MDCSFKSTKKLSRDVLDLLDKSKTPRHCGFPMANLQSDEIVDYVPNVASWSILLKTLDFWGRMRKIHILIDYSGLEDKLHYCKKSCAIFMLVCFHLLCFAPGLLLAGNAKFRSAFFPLEHRFLFEDPGAFISPLIFSYNALCKAFWEKYNLNLLPLQAKVNIRYRKYQ